MMNTQLKNLSLTALFTALIAMATMAISIPVPIAQGYIHLGDGVIIAISFFFGWRKGVASAAIGSALADILTGYAHWVLFTLIIKGLMALLVAKLCRADKPLFCFRNISTLVAAEVVMVVGYFLAGIVLTGALASLQSIPANGVQAIGGMVTFSVIAAALKKANVAKYVQ